MVEGIMQQQQQETHSLQRWARDTTLTEVEDSQFRQRYQTLFLEDLMFLISALEEVIVRQYLVTFQL